MRIETSLPYPFCDNCPEFILHVDEQIMFLGFAGSERVMTVMCKNAAKCKQLKKNLEEREGEHVRKL